MRAVRFVALPLAFAAATGRGQALLPPLAQHDFVIRNFAFTTGDTMPELRMHYITMGAPRRDAGGNVRNAVMVLHGTGGSGNAFTSRTFAGELFGPGQLLDTARYFVILPDGLGHGKSSKPSDGMRMKFPHYTYDDMVEAQFRLLVEGLGVSHLRLIMGTSMGCMHAWVWAERYEAFTDAIVPLACAPTQIAGRNRMIRKVIADDIMSDPEWKGGDYATQPRGLRAAMGALWVMTSAPLQQHKTAPTWDAADKAMTDYLDRQSRAYDANDVLYAYDASRTYDPSAGLEKIRIPVLAINSADDFVNPPELGLMEKLIPRVKNGRFVLIPISDATRGHGTHSLPAVWKSYLAEFLTTLPPIPTTFPPTLK